MLYGMCNTLAYNLFHRDIRKVQGFSRETLIALTTTIESREWVRRSKANKGLTPEHPRASTTDDVECFFSLLRSMIGAHFTVKDVQTTWRKLCIEFSKRLDKHLPFYYFTSTHERFNVGEKQDFNVGTFKRSSNNPRHQRVRREQPGNLAPGRATLVKSGARSIRRTFHNVPIDLPPPPAQDVRRNSAARPQSPTYKTDSHTATYQTDGQTATKPNIRLMAIQLQSLTYQTDSCNPNCQPYIQLHGQ